MTDSIRPTQAESKILAKLIEDHSDNQRRLGKTESQLNSLAEIVKTLSDGFKEFASETNRNFQKVRETLDEKTAPIGRTNWTAVFGTLSIGLGLISFWSIGPSKDLDRVESQLSKSVERGATRWEANSTRWEKAGNALERLSDFQENTKERFGTVDTLIEKLDEVLQREMRLLDERLQNEFNARIERAQSDADKALADLNRRSGKRFNREDFEKSVLPRIIKIEGWIHDHDRTVVQLNATQDASIEDLKDEVNRLRDLLREVRETRFPGEDGRNLMVDVSILKKLVSDIQAEQLRRTKKVYDPNTP